MRKINFERIEKHEQVGEIGLIGYNWVSFKEIEFMGKLIDVEFYFEVERKDSELSKKQIEYFISILNSESFFKKIAKGIFNYYTDMYDELQETHTELQEINEINMLSSMLRFPICVFISDENEYIGASMNCIWEPEHGLGVKIVDGEVVEVGFQDIIL